jgi:hydroxymethylpyrimidine/phosphomethylpyrimidine kinase
VEVRKTLRIALSIAGSDSGGGAGIQADLKTFADLGVHGTSAITCVTAQNPKGVARVEAMKPRVVSEQLVAIFSELPPSALKTGMLYNAGIVRTVAKFLASRDDVPLVVDPVMVATSGARLTKNSAVEGLKAELLPMAALITPNLAEAEALVGEKIRSPEEMRAAAREIHGRFHCAALVKGGHLKGSTQAVDIFFDGDSELLLSSPFIKGIRPHGTGCTYSAAITAFLALGHRLPRAVALGKDYITSALVNGRSAAGHFVLSRK